jgi:hypothetical protein
MLTLTLRRSRWHYKIFEPCYPKMSALMSHPLLNGSILPLVANFFNRLLTQTRICFPFSRHSFGYHTSTFLLMCKSRGRCLVISSFYHTNILFIISPLLYNIMYPAWFATSYNCAPFMVSVWSYH